MKNPKSKLCKGNVTVCRKCKYRYKKGDSKWQQGGACPECNEPRRCEAWAVVDYGYDVCTKHGAGKPKKGKPGGYHKREGMLRKNFLPERLKETYEASFDDPTLLEFERDLALSETFINDLLGRLHTGESGQLWNELQKAWVDYEKKQRKATKTNIQEDLFDAQAALDNIGDLITDGADDNKARVDVLNVLEQRRKTIDSEYRRLEKMQQMIRTERVIEFVRAVALIIERHVDSIETRMAIGLDVENLMIIEGTAEKVPPLTQETP